MTVTDHGTRARFDGRICLGLEWRSLVWNDEFGTIDGVHSNSSYVRNILVVELLLTIGYSGEEQSPIDDSKG